MTDHEKQQWKQGGTVIWAPVSIAVPFVTIACGFLVVASVSKGVGGDMVGPAYFAYAEVALGIAGIFGVAAAIRSILKREGWITLASVGLLLNLAFIAFGAVIGWHLLR